ncbi:hypothetical protein [Halalkalibacter krulwichiae]|uniref:Uncharacterized protein n=1 Tax=Halalkalibacter krulwichiae TaxID=199441 RepID=A0A1X9MGV1_9BACI|nr:hypothetical protein [Halalkalibacter krulwichiae]ARK31854.1 hypothetical protein BkAM31D_19555 [Halalkalibacter krulwichiae]
MARNNSGRVRFAALPQSKQHRELKKKQFARKKDSRDWTSKLFDKLKNSEEAG